MSSKKCVKCGFVSFAGAETCKRCGAKLTDSQRAAQPPPQTYSGQPVAVKKRSPFIVYLVGGIISLFLGALVFGATADQGTALPLGLFTAVFVGGMLLAVIIGGYLLKAKPNVESRTPSTSRKSYARVGIYTILSMVVTLSFFLLRFGSDFSSDVRTEKMGELTGACLVPGIITVIWMRFAKEEWSWVGVGLRYILLFMVFAFSVVLRMMFDK
ncbi:MAG TPA: hypothetical protein VJT09_06525 [Pyrinomonadaceae bacterium]|nr:hypothetical protein [Pyrinomonadaceae bacterium]